MEAENKFLSAFQQLLNTQPESLKDSEQKELEGSDRRLVCFSLEDKSCSEADSGRFVN